MSKVMKREIKFRGRNKNGEWLYGDILQVAKYSFIVPSDGDWFDFIPWKKDNVFHMPRSQYVVNTDTIGQYTGLKDKNSKEIYEGDIVYSEFADGSNCMFLVGWNNKLSCFGVMDEYAYRSKQLGYDFPEFDNHLFIKVLKNSKIFKIIGNIYNNPELLKGE